MKSGSFSSQKPSFFPDYFLVGVVFLIASIPLLQFGYAGDDALNSQIRGDLLAHHARLFPFMKDWAIAWMRTGRLYPLSGLSTFPLFYIVGSSYLLYNWIHWLVMTAALGCAYLFFKKLDFGKNPHLFVYFILFPFSWSLFPSSGLVSYALLISQTTIFIMITLIGYVHFIQTLKMRYLIGVILFYILALLTYEVSLVVAPVALILNKYFCGSYLNRTQWKTFGPIVLITFLYLACVFFLRHHYGVGYDGTAFGTFPDFLIALLKQLCGVIPLLYFFHTSSGFPLSSGYYVLVLLLMISTFVVIYRFLNQAVSIFNDRLLVLIGVSLQIFPAAMVAVTKKYQLWLVFGNSHIPVFIQLTGFCMLLVCLLNYVGKKLKKIKKRRAIWVKASLSGLVALITGFSFLANEAVTHAYNKTIQYPQNLYQAALGDGMFNDLPSHAIILQPNYLAYEFVWNTIAFRTQLINRSDILLFDLKGVAPFIDKQTEPQFNKRFFAQQAIGLFYLNFDHLPKKPDSGFVMLGHIIKHTGISPDMSLQLDNIKIFYTCASRKELKQIFDRLVASYHLDSERSKDSLAFLEQKMIKNTRLSGIITFPAYFTFHIHKE